MVFHSRSIPSDLGSNSDVRQHETRPHKRRGGQRQGGREGPAAVEPGGVVCIAGFGGLTEALTQPNGEKFSSKPDPSPKDREPCLMLFLRIPAQGAWQTPQQNQHQQQWGGGKPRPQTG